MFFKERSPCNFCIAVVLNVTGNLPVNTLVFSPSFALVPPMTRIRRNHTYTWESAESEQHYLENRLLNSVAGKMKHLGVKQADRYIENIRQFHYYLWD